MKVKIVTVYNSLNPGSFLQATSLYQAVNSLGYNCSFFNTKSRNLRKRAFLESLYLLKKGRLKAVVEKYKTVNVYLKALSEYKIEDDIAEDDIYVLGSDEIWNVARENMAKYPVFWGQGLDYKRCLSYAPSLNNATADDLTEYNFVKEALENLSAISVRDSFSKEQLSSLTNRPVELVCDPTVLVYPDRYATVPEECELNSYILVYIYANSGITQKQIDEVTSFARENGKMIVAFGASVKWADKFVNGSAEDFLKYIKNADYVCTSTFHGTMLSLIFQKQFAVFGRKNRKVKELMDTMQIDRQVEDGTVETVLTTVYDYQACDGKLRNLHDYGINYLKEQISALEEKYASGKQ